MLRCIFSCILLIAIFSTCKQPASKGSWHYTKTFPLSNVNPISITGDANNLYVSSGLKTEVHKLNYDGGLQLPIKNLRKPKYINMLTPGVFVVAESEAHVTSMVNGQDYINTIPTNENLDTPYGISVVGNSMVITDYFKNRIYYNKEGKVMSFGSPGANNDQFNGPTDIQIKNGLIYIADSRNNRVVVYDDLGKFKFSFGEKEGIKIVGGIYVSEEEIIVTDYQGNRVLIYDLKGNLSQILTEKFDQPSDAFVYKKELFIANYYSNSIMVFNRF